MTKISYEQQIAMGLVKNTPREFVAPAPATQSAGAALPPSTALAPVAPIAPRALIDSHNRLIDVYAAQAKQAAKVGEVLPAHDTSAPRGYSSANELQARNARFYFTVGALVLVEAIAAWGMVSTANIAALIGDVWTIPLWLSLTGIAAFVTIQHVHGSEQRLTPENLELNRQENEFAIQHMDAQTRQLAINLAAQIDLERVKLERERADIQRQQAMAQTMEVRARIGEQMARHTTPQATYNRLNNYRPTQQGTQQGKQDGVVNATNGPGTAIDNGVAWYAHENEMDAPSAFFELETDSPEPEAPIGDPVRERLLNFTADLFQRDKTTGEYMRMHQDGRLKKGVIAPWAFRSDLTQAQRRQLEELLRQITPDLFLYDEPTKTWALNLKAYPKVFMAIEAIGSAYTIA